MRDPYHTRGGASGPYKDRGDKSGNGERVRERDRDRYTERDRDRDRDRGSDRDRENTQSWKSSKSFNHVNDLNKQKILNNSDTREHSRDRHGPDRQKDRGSVQTLKEKLGSSCQTAFIRVTVHPSASQEQVSDTLRGMGLSVEDEFRCPKSDYSIDMQVHDMRVNTKSSTGAAAGRVVEFDGPSHFLMCRLPVGGTLMKWRHLELLGYTVVSLPFWEWNQLTESDERKEYLRDKLHIS
jgi:hypothetical protein